MAVWTRSTGFSAKGQLRQIGQILQLRGYGSSQLVLAEIKPLKIDRSANCDGTDPVNWFLLKDSTVSSDRLPSCGGMDPVNWFPKGTAPSDWTDPPAAWYGSSQLVLVEIKPLKIGQVSQLRRHRPSQLVSAQGQHGQFR